MNWINILAVFLGSGLGGACRYMTSRLVQHYVPGAIFPWGTFVVNVLGCFIIGILYGFIDRGSILNPQIRLLLAVGFCGGFTTFSTFINENYLLFSQGATYAVTALIYMLLSVIIGFILLYLGHSIAN